jgi:hypothetical protein
MKVMKLDHSPRSVRRVEKILGRMHEDYRRTGSDEGLNGVALEFAAYIVTVIDTHFGPAEWQRDHPTMGEGTFPCHWRGKDLFPYAWCQKRIFDGPGDDVWSKFETLVLQDAG